MDHDHLGLESSWGVGGLVVNACRHAKTHSYAPVHGTCKLVLVGFL